MSERHVSDELTTDPGQLPRSAGIVLFVAAWVGLIWFTFQVVSPRRAVVLIGLAGCCAACGLRLQAGNRLIVAVGGKLLLWGSMVLFPVGAGWVFAEQLTQSSLGMWLIALVPPVVLLASFGITLSTLRTSEQDAWISGVAEYIYGTVILLAFALGWAGIIVIESQGLLSAIGLGRAIEAAQSIFGSERGWVRAAIGMTVYIPAVVITQHIVRVFPLELVVPATNLERLRQLETYRNFLRFGMIGIGVVYLGLVGSLSFTPAMTPIVDATTSLPVLFVVVGITLTGGIGILTHRIAARNSTRSWESVISVCFPPVIITIAAVTAGYLYVDDVLQNSVGEAVAASSVAPPVLSTFTGGGLASVVLAAIAGVMLVGGGIVYIPVIIVPFTRENWNLSGIVSYVVPMTLVSVLLVRTGAEPWLIISSVALIVGVWEVGRALATAAGELRIHTATAHFPVGFMTIISVRTIAMLTVVTSGSGVMLLLFNSLNRDFITPIVSFVLIGLFLTAVSALILVLTR